MNKVSLSLRLRLCVRKVPYANSDRRHPETSSLAVGGHSLSMHNKGTTSLLVMTDGGAGGVGRIRRLKSKPPEISLESPSYWGEYPDTAIPLDRESIQRVERVILDVRPDFIFLHSQDDTHQDHRPFRRDYHGNSLHEKCALVRGPTTQNFSPNVFVDINGVLKNKIAALQAHESQETKTNIEGMNILDIVQSLAHFRGIQGRVKNAEAFVPLRLFINITA